MKIEIQSIAQDLEESTPQVGDIYPAQGNRPTAAWVVVAVSEGGRTAYMLGIDRHGNVCSTTSYNFRALEDRARIGRIADLENLTLTVQSCAGMGRAFAR